MANKMEVIRKWFGESAEQRIVELIEASGVVFDSTLMTGRENRSVMRVLGEDLGVPCASYISMETLIARIVLEVERAFRAEEQQTYAKESK